MSAKGDLANAIRIATAARGPQSSEETTAKKIALYIVRAARQQSIEPDEVAMPDDQQWGILSRGSSHQRAVLPTPSQVGLYFNYRRNKLTDSVLPIAWAVAQQYIRDHPTEFHT